ncbi:unnamed protein product [Nezara viridula]|uniref:Uncharacterized protein n=1 Tax=Nezara viridula TaxID=85310 RepID=A0A9P0MNI3_NEZVI|nr:unnamed protein product [Nezara viridula]
MFLKGISYKLSEHILKLVIKEKQMSSKNDNIDIYKYVNDYKHTGRIFF